MEYDVQTFLLTKNLYKVSTAPEMLVHILEVGVNVIPIPAQTGNKSMGNLVKHPELGPVSNSDIVRADQNNTDNLGLEA